MKSLASRERRRYSVSGALLRFLPLGSFTGLGALAFMQEAFVLGGLLGAGAAYSGYRLLDREGNQRRQLRRRARSNLRGLQRVSREDPVAAPQMKRIAALQNGLLESWELLPGDYHPLLDEDIFTIMEEVENAAWLARRRAALRRHLEYIEQSGISRRIESLEKDLEDLEEGSAMRATFEHALAGRREELAGYGEMLNGISVINAQLEEAESLLGGLRGELLTLDSSLAPQALESSLVRLKERVALFRQSMDEVARAVDTTRETGQLQAR